VTPTPLDPPAERPSGNRAVIKMLAKCLADNYFCTTVGYVQRKRGRHVEDYERVFDESIKLPEESVRARNIIVVGAGASYAAFGGEAFPLAAQAIAKLRESLHVDALLAALSAPRGAQPSRATSLPNRFHEEEQFFGSAAGASGTQLDFESQLAILAQFYTSHQIRDAMSAFFGKRYWPHMISETMAHLLKHRFVDVIINYNFDETLDQAIEEEVRGGDYCKIVSDGDCPRHLSDLVVGTGLKVPLYIKPHGTISHKSTLRFTKRAYLDAPSDLLRFTETILHGYTVEGESSSRLPVNLIAVGFNFGSVELSRMLRGQDKLTVWHINKPGVDGKIKHPETLESVEHHDIGIETDLAAVFESLIGSLHGLFRDPYTPRHLVRHQLVHDLLVEPGCGHAECKDCPPGVVRRVPARESDYLRARVFVELAIAVAKGNGRIDLGSLVHDRVGIYFKAWRETEDLRDEGIRDKSSLREFCRQFGLKLDKGFVGNLFTAPSKKKLVEYVRPPAAVRDPKVAARPGAEDLALWIWSKLSGMLSKVDDARLRRSITGMTPEVIDRRVIAPLAGLVSTDVRELAPRFNSDELLLLRGGKRRAVIHTNLGMALAFNDIIHKSDAHLLLAITEHAAFLEKLLPHATVKQGEDQRRLRQRASVIVATPFERSELNRRRDRYRDLLIGDDYELPYWAHNEHLIVAMRMDATVGRFTPIAGIWYRREGLTKRINPIRVDDRKDLKHLVLTFFGYAHKATQFQSDHGVPDVTHRVARRARNDTLLLWWTEMMNAAQGAAGGLSPKGEALHP
jgi:hypothetical protein